MAKVTKNVAGDLIKKLKPQKKNFKKKKHPEKKKNVIGTTPNTNWEAFLKLQKENNLPNVSKPKKKTNSEIKRVLKKKNNANENKNKVKGDEKLEIWFDNVDPALLSEVKSATETTKEEIKHSENITKYVALDCEMVGVGSVGKESVLARVSLVNCFGDCIYDEFVKTIESVVDYRTEFSGVRAENLKSAPHFATVQKAVADILKGRILVGHALQNDLKVLMLSHPRRQIRDTSKYKPFHKLLKTRRPALRKLALSLLNEKIQEGEHSSVIDARATMEIFQLHKRDWEASLRNKKNTSGEKQSDEQKSSPQKVFMGKNTNKSKKANKWQKRKQEKKNKQKDE